MPIQYIKRSEDKYAAMGFEPYRWVVNEETAPWKPLGKPLSECRLGLVASGGIYAAGQVAFHYKDDTSIRSIPNDIKTGNLRVTHFAYDLTAARTDPNVVFPIDTLRNLRQEGFIGDLANHFYGFMGGIYSAKRVIKDVAPQLTKCLLAEKVDALLLVPV